MPVALILGIGGQDGSYLAEILLDRGYEVHGLYRRSSVDNLGRIAHIRDKVTLHQGDITEPSSVAAILRKANPDEVYNEADQDHVGWSLALPGYSFDVTAKAVVTTLEAIRAFNKEIRCFQPCSATMFGDAPPPQNEGTPHNPQSPYACAKTAAYHIARYYRQAHGMFVSTAILYNHDSPERGEEYLLHQICRSAWQVLTTDATEIVVGDPDMVIDIGFAKEYMKAAVDILQHGEPDDFILSSGFPCSIREIVQSVMTFLECEEYKIVTDASFLRCGRQPRLIGDSTKAREKFGFSPRYGASDLIKMLIAPLAIGGYGKDVECLSP